MNVYIAPTPAIPRGFDKLETGSGRGQQKASPAPDSRQPGASWKRLSWTLVSAAPYESPVASPRDLEDPRMAAQSIQIGMEVRA